MRRNIKIKKVLKHGEEDHYAEVLGIHRFVYYRYMSLDGRMFQTSDGSVKACRYKRDLWLKELAGNIRDWESKWPDEQKKVLDHVLDSLDGLFLEKSFVEKLKILEEYKYNKDQVKS